MLLNLAIKCTEPQYMNAKVVVNSCVILDDNNICSRPPLRCCTEWLNNYSFNIDVFLTIFFMLIKIKEKQYFVFSCMQMYYF